MPLRERKARGASPEPVPGAVGQQAYGYQPISAAEHFIPPEILSPCLSAEARTGTPSALLASASRPLPIFDFPLTIFDFRLTPACAVRITDGNRSATAQSAMGNRQSSMTRRHHAGS